MIDRIRSWNESLDRPVDLRALAVLRIAMGPIVLVHLRPFLTAAADGEIYSDRFTLPFWEWYPQLPETTYVTMLWVLVAAAVMLSAGLWTRIVAWITAGGVAYNVFLSQTHFHHNRAFLIILLVGLAVLPSGRTVSLDAALARRRGRRLEAGGGTRLALTVLRVEIAAVYVASGFSKLVDSDWFGGTVLRLRIVQHRPRLADVGVPEAVVDVLADPEFMAVAAKVIVLTELFIGLGLLYPRTRKAAIWVAVAFHVSIQFTAAVQVFSIAGLAALVVWIDRPAHDRVVHAGRRWRSVIHALDWTGRFDLVPGSRGIRVDDGSQLKRSAQARWFVLSRLPLTFWAAAPILLFRSLFSRGGGQPEAPH